MITATLSWLALGSLCVAIVAAIGAISARSLFAMCMHLIVVGAAVAATVVLLDRAEGGLATALFAVAWAPLVLLAATLLSTRAAKAARGRWPWLSVLSVAAAVALMVWPLVDMGAQAPPREAPPAGLGFMIAPLLLVLAAACVGMLGYGERGALANGDERL